MSARRARRWTDADLATIPRSDPRAAQWTPAEREAFVRQGASPLKFRNVRCEVDGHVFASKLEGRRYRDLRTLELAGAIRALRLQPRYRIEVRGLHVCDYVADFDYRDAEGLLVVEDCKSKATRTPVYRLKRKLMLAVHGILVREIERPRRKAVPM